MSSSDGDQPDAVVQCLIGIGAELTKIRQELQRLNGDEPAAEPAVPDTSNAITCRSCGKSFQSRQRADRHARDEHGAPRGHEAELFT
jgi:hypothetical protein